MAKIDVPAIQEPQPQTEDLRRATFKTGFLWGGLVLLVSIAGFAVQDASVRLQILSGLLILMAAGEGLAAFLNVFQARWFAERNGRLYDPAYHGVMQDFGFYNFAMALLFATAAIDPVRNIVVLWVAIAFYLIHGMTHILRYLGLYYGGETSIPTRPRHFELRDGLQLIFAVSGMVLFFP